MTKVHAYLARIKDQEKEVIAVPDGAGRALCVSFDKHWTLTREWDELHIIAPLVEDEGNDDELDPAVTKADIEQAVAEWVDDAPEVVNEVWSLVSGADPAVHVVRESDIAAVEVESYGDGWKADGRVHIVRTLPEARDDVQSDAQVLARSLAVARAVESGQVVGPVEAKARELYEHVYDGRFEGGSSGVQAEYRKIAAYVLGQEDRHVDQ